ncbi:hypothetical protein EGI20_14515 [Aquitalea sp. S1-19]|nr:hypothetical protein [Aquitalea sp. S1-19]
MDGAVVYITLARMQGITHNVVQARPDLCVRVFHIRSVKTYRQRLKNWMAYFHGAASKYLLNYLGWRHVPEC